jgi:hypothetical protein
VVAAGSYGMLSFLGSEWVCVCVCVWLDLLMVDRMRLC